MPQSVFPHQAFPKAVVEMWGGEAMWPAKFVWSTRAATTGSHWPLATLCRGKGDQETISPNLHLITSIYNAGFFFSFSTAVSLEAVIVDVPELHLHTNHRISIDV